MYGSGEATPSDRAVSADEWKLFNGQCRYISCIINCELRTTYGMGCFNVPCTSTRRYLASSLWLWYGYGMAGSLQQQIKPFSLSIP